MPAIPRAVLGLITAALIIGCGRSAAAAPGSGLEAGPVVRLPVARAATQADLERDYRALGPRLTGPLRRLINGAQVIGAVRRDRSRADPWELDLEITGLAGSAAASAVSPIFSSLAHDTTLVDLSPAAAPQRPGDAGTVWVSAVPGPIHRVRWEFACPTAFRVPGCSAADQVTFTVPVVDGLATAWVRHVGRCPPPGCLRPDAVTWLAGHGVSSGYTS